MLYIIPMMWKPDDVPVLYMNIMVWGLLFVDKVWRSVGVSGRVGSVVVVVVVNVIVFLIF